MSDPRREPQQADDVRKRVHEGLLEVLNRYSACEILGQCKFAVQPALTAVEELAAERDALRSQLVELAKKERREFAWAEEYMAKARHLEIDNDALRSRVRRLETQLEDADKSLLLVKKELEDFLSRVDR